MKPEDNNFEKNISRLVKLARDTDKPSEKFADSLINDALMKLHETEKSQKRERRSTIMTIKRVFAYAASILIVCGILIAVITSHSQKATSTLVSQKIQEKETVVSNEYEKSEPVKIKKEARLAAEPKASEPTKAEDKMVAAGGSYKPSEPAKIEYVKEAAKSEKTQSKLEEKMVATATEKPHPSVPGLAKTNIALRAQEKLSAAEEMPAAASLSGAAGAKLVPLDIKLPNKVFIGTPQNSLVSNLEKPLGHPRPPFYAPEGTKNVALGKAVISSKEPIIGETQMITDGDKEAADGSFVELPPGLQYVAIDLGAEYNIYAIVLWHDHRQDSVYFDVVVQVADDAHFKTNVRILFNNDANNSAGLGAGSDMHYTETYEGKLIDAKGVKARYVRLYSNGNSIDGLNRYTEVEVYGKPAESSAKKPEVPVEIKLPKPTFLGTPVSGLAMKEITACNRALDYSAGQYPPAHGGTRPPNGEDVDAMFFKNYGVNPFVDTEDDHLSTFAVDVDTGSYTIVRGYLHDGHMPPEKAVRVEEFVNYFKYSYAAPQKDVFAVYTEAAPWKFGMGRKNSYLMRIGLKGKQISEENRKPAVLTFVIDTSGSMSREDRLGLVKRCLEMLVNRLKPQDKIGIAVYGSRGMKYMDYKGLDQKAEILAAIESLQSSGSTFAEEGIRIGYEMAESAHIQGYINRVILCSDGVANVGQTGSDAILEVIKKKAEKGITLSAIGFGMGNYNDQLMEQLGDKGNGHYVYIDNIAEAKRIFEENLTGTLQVIARDVKVQVDFDPNIVRSYRLIGYENRDVPDDKFRDDKYDGGEVGAGHSVTALYELKLWPGKKEGTVATTYVRYKDADTSAVTEFKSSLSLEDFRKSIDDASSDFRLAATAAEFAEIMRKSYWAKGATLEPVLKHSLQLGQEFNGNADVIELADLISKAKSLDKKSDSEASTTGG